MNIDLRTHDQHEHGLRLEQRLQQPVFDLRLAQQIRERLKDRKEAEAFAEADRRMRSRP
jgi:hypothetical protein